MTNPPFPPYPPGQGPAAEAEQPGAESAGGAAPAELPNVIQKVDQKQLKHFVTAIRSAEHQVGEHIIRALQDDDTVAVLTTVMVAPDGVQRIVSAGLDPEMMQVVQTMLARATKSRDEEVPCVGFHCYVRPKGITGVAPEPPPDAAP